MEGLKKLGGEVHKLKTDLLVHASYSNFPFMQNYYRKDYVDVEIYGKSPKNNGGKTEKITLSVAVETDKRNYHKTKSGTPANSIHSIDSDLLKMVVNHFPHPMATNHDAFFATPSRIGELDVWLLVASCGFSLLPAASRCVPAASRVRLSVIRESGPPVPKYPARTQRYYGTSK